MWNSATCSQILTHILIDIHNNATIGTFYIAHSNEIMKRKQKAKTSAVKSQRMGGQDMLVIPCKWGIQPLTNCCQDQELWADDLTIGQNWAPRAKPSLQTFCPFPKSDMWRAVQRLYCIFKATNPCLSLHVGWCLDAIQWQRGKGKTESVVRERLRVRSFRMCETPILSLGHQASPTKVRQWCVRKACPTTTKKKLKERQEPKLWSKAPASV